MKIKVILALMCAFLFSSQYPKPDTLTIVKEIPFDSEIELLKIEALSAKNKADKADNEFTIFVYNLIAEDSAH